MTLAAGDMDRPDRDNGDCAAPNRTAGDERVLAKELLFRDVRHWLLLGPFGVLTYLLVGELARFGPVIGWPVALMFALFASLALLNLVAALITAWRGLADDVTASGWRIAQGLLSLVNLAIYGGLAVLVWSALPDWGW